MPFSIALIVAALLAVGGAAVGSAWATGLGAVAVLAGLAALIRPPAPRLLLRAGLALLAVAVIVRVQGWTTLPSDRGDLLAFVVDPDRERNRFLRESAQAAALILACACLAAALLRTARERRRRPAATAPAATAATAVASAAVAGMALLAWSAWSAIGSARDARPVTRHPNAFLEPGVEISVAVGPGPTVDIRSAAAVALLLLGAALTTRAVVSLSHPAQRRTASGE